MNRQGPVGEGANQFRKIGTLRGKSLNGHGISAESAEDGPRGSCDAEQHTQSQQSF